MVHYSIFHWGKFIVSITDGSSASFELGVRKWGGAETLHKYKQADGCLKNDIIKSLKDDCIWLPWMHLIKLEQHLNEERLLNSSHIVLNFSHTAFNNRVWKISEDYQLSLKHIDSGNFKKQPIIGVLKICSKFTEEHPWRTPKENTHAYFQNTFSQEHLCRTASEFDWIHPKDTTMMPNSFQKNVRIAS